MRQHDDWVRYPVGKLGKGAWCEQCMRYSVRNSTCDFIAVRGNPSASSGQEVLLYRRKKDPQKSWWALPAGYLEWDETLEECVKREVKEELGVVPQEVKLVGVYSDPKRDLDGRQNIAHCFVGTISGRIKPQKSEVGELRWFELDKLPERVAFDHKKMIEDYAKEVRSKE